MTTYLIEFKVVNLDVCVNYILTDGIKKSYSDILRECKEKLSEKYKCNIQTISFVKTTIKNNSYIIYKS